MDVPEVMRLVIVSTVVDSHSHPTPLPCRRSSYHCDHGISTTTPIWRRFRWQFVCLITNPHNRSDSPSLQHHPRSFAVLFFNFGATWDSEFKFKCNRLKSVLQDLRVWSSRVVAIEVWDLHGGAATMATAPAHAPTYSLKSTLAFSSFDSSRVNSKGFSACTSLRVHPRGRARAGLEGESSASEYKESVNRPVLRRRKTVPTPASPTVGDSEDTRSMETVLVEDERVSLEGVGRVDREAPSSSFSWGRVGVLAAGDLVALVTFAVIGRASHGLTTLNWDALRTADPFIAGWLLGSFFLGGYGPDGQGMNGVTRAATSALKSWAVGVPLGLVIRSIVTSHMPAQAFILVSLGSLLFLMVGWRVAFVYVFTNGGNTVEKRPANRSGGVFEFLELLTSLVRRW